MTIQAYNHRKRVWIVWIRNFFSFLSFRVSTVVVYIFAPSALFVSGCRHRRHRRIRRLPLANRPAVTLSPPVRPSTPPHALYALYTCSPVPVCRDRVSNPNRQSDPAFLLSSDKIRFVAAEESSLFLLCTIDYLVYYRLNIIMCRRRRCDPTPEGSPEHD